jgi:hypothetical protein
MNERELESRLSARAKPQPAYLARERLLGQLTAARKRERAVAIGATVLAAFAFVIGFVLSSRDERAPREPEPQFVPRATPTALATALGIPANELEYMSAFWRVGARVARIAPVVGSAPGQGLPLETP